MKKGKSMDNKRGNKIQRLLGMILVVVAVLTLALPAEASEYNPPTQSNLKATPTIEINPDAHHQDQDGSHMRFPAPLSVLELAAASCSGGSAGEYPCQGIDFMSRVPLTSFNGNPASASNLWGYVDLDDNREYAIIGLRNGTGIVDVTDPVNPVVIETIVGVTSQWREVKVYQFRNATTNRWDAYAYVTTEGAGGGIQIIDLTQLPNSVSLAGTWMGVSTSHTDQISNINFTTNVANNSSFPPILYISGANTGGLRFLSLANPTSLTEVGSWNTGTYSHDTYPHVFTDARANQCAPGHNPCEVVFNFSGTAGLKIIDVTNKSAPVTLSTLTYSQLGYVHSGWISNDGNYIFLHDELDEQNFGGNSRIRTIDITNLTAPTVSTIYSGPTTAIDHNGYTIGNKFYFSNYTRGIGILNVTNPNAPVELGYFDTYPTSNSATFNGAWGVYPFLPSGNILISDIQRGLIVVREQSTPPATPIATSTPTNTPGPSNTPTPTRTPTNPSSAGNTGFLGPATNAAQTSSSGDNNGYEIASSNAHADGGGVAQDVNSGTNNSSSCTANSKDKHRFYDFNISLPAAATVKGIEVRLDAFADSTSSAPRICVQLSWDGGTTWTNAKQTPTLTTSEATYVLGSPVDTWGRTWAPANLSNANFRVRVIDIASSSGAASRDFSLDWISVRVSY